MGGGPQICTKSRNCSLIEEKASMIDFNTSNRSCIRSGYRIALPDRPIGSLHNPNFRAAPDPADRPPLAPRHARSHTPTEHTHTYTCMRLTLIHPYCHILRKKFARNFAKRFSHDKETLGNYRAPIGDYRDTIGSPSRRTTMRPYSATISVHI